LEVVDGPPFLAEDHGDLSRRALRSKMHRASLRGSANSSLTETLLFIATTTVF
jgi:hypothetical protein